MFSFKKTADRRYFFVSAQIHHHKRGQAENAEIASMNWRIDTPAGFCTHKEVVENATQQFALKYPNNVIDNVHIFAICEMSKADLDKFISEK